jgi:hypothetical protein
MGDLKTPKASYLMGPSGKNHCYLEETKADLWDINKSLNLDQARAEDIFYIQKRERVGLTAFAANHKKEYGLESGRFNWFRNSTGVPGLKSDNTAIEANFSSMKSVKRAPVMFVSRKHFLLTQSQDFCDKNYSFCSKGGLKDVFSGPKLNLPQDLDIVSDPYNCPKSILVGGLLLNPTVNLIELEADEDKDFLLKTLALKFPKVMSDVKRVFLVNRLPYSGVPIPLSDGARYAESLLGLASDFSGGYSEMTDKYRDS